MKTMFAKSLAFNEYSRKPFSPFCKLLDVPNEQYLDDRHDIDEKTALIEEEDSDEVNHMKHFYLLFPSQSA